MYLPVVSNRAILYFSIDLHALYGVHDLRRVSEVSTYCRCSYLEARHSAPVLSEHASERKKSKDERRIARIGQYPDHHLLDWSNFKGLEPLQIRTVP